MDCTECEHNPCCLFRQKSNGKYGWHYSDLCHDRKRVVRNLIWLTQPGRRPECEK